MGQIDPPLLLSLGSRTFCNPDKKVSGVISRRVAGRLLKRDRNLSASPHLLSEMDERVANRRARDLHQSLERPVHLLDQKDRAGDR